MESWPDGAKYEGDYIDGKKENLREFIEKLSKEDIDKYYDSINQNLENILDKVSPNRLCKKIVELI